MNKVSESFNLIQVSRNQFLLVLVLFASVLTMAASLLMWNDIATFVVRFQFKSEVESKFGFNGGELIVNGDLANQHRYFVLTEVERGGEFETAGLRKDDVVIVEVGCRFGKVVRSNEGILLTKLHYAQNGEIIPLTVINSEAVKASRFDLNDFRKINFKVQR